jgi:glycogen debranching enzyme
MLSLDLILKNNELCLVGESRGRVAPEEVGLFLRDTRFLDRLDVTFAGQPLVTLEVQTPTPDRAIITATNPEMRLGGTAIPGHTALFRLDVHVTDIITCGITIQNYGAAALNGDLQVAIGADFKDMFAVRGWNPKQPVQPQAPHIDGTSAVLSGTSADGSTVTTRITATGDASISRLDAELASAVTVTIPVDLPHGDSKQAEVLIHPEPLGTPPRETASFAADEGFTPQLVVATPSPAFDAFLAQCDADLALLQTTFPDGNIPAAGIPWYVAPFGRDSLIVALQTLHLYPVRSEHTLKLLAALQGTKHDRFTEEAPGKILHEMRYGDMARNGDIPHTPYYGSVDATPLFVMTFAKHYLWHRDDALYDALIDNVKRAMAWFEADGDLDGDGFIEYSGEKLEQAHLPQQGWKDSHDSLNFADGRPAQGPIALVEAQGYVYAAYAWMADVARTRGDAAWAEELRANAEAMRERVEAKFWMDEQAFYAQALDVEKKQVDAISSNVGHLLYCGLPSQDRAGAVARRLAAPDMNSGWGIRTLSTEMATYNPMSYHNGSVWPHDISLIMTGLQAYGHSDLAREQAIVITELVAEDPELRIAELYCGFSREESPTGPVNYPRTCLPQAWAAGAGVLAASTLLGITLDDTGELSATPYLPDEWDAMKATGFRAGDRRFGVRAERAANGWSATITDR